MLLSSFFSLLPDVLLEEIVRNVSARPRHPNWRAYMGEGEASKLVSLSSPLHEAASNLLNHLTATNENFARGKTDSLVVRGAARGLPGLLAHVLTEVHLRAVPLDVSWVRQIATQCDQLRVLEIHYAMPSAPFVRLLRSRGKLLRSLSAWFVGSHSHLDAISEHCTSLQSLELQYLRRSSPDLWKAVGKTLTQLTLSFSIALRPPETIEHVRDHCNNITELSILENYHGFDAEVSQSVAHLYSSIGRNLEKASLLDVNPECCAQVLEACPNMTVSAGHMHHLMDLMNLLGPIIKELRIDFHGDTYNIWDNHLFSEAAEKCFNVENVWTRSSLLTCVWSSDFLNVFFEHKKPKIKTFHWNEVILEEFSHDAIELISTQTGALEEISLNIGGFQALDFEYLATKNPNLMKADIHFVRPALNSINGIENGETIFIQIIDSFMKSPNLKFLNISIGGENTTLSNLRQKRKSIQDACVKYRWRNVFIMVAGVEYLS